MTIHGVEAVICDLDGTLVDSEVLAEQVIAELLLEQGIDDPEVEHARYHGLTWERIAEVLADAHPQLAAEGFPAALQARFHAAFVTAPPPLVPGAREALLAAGKRFPLAIASSSNRETVEHFVDRLKLRHLIRVRVCAEDCERAKPDPQCYRRAAAQLGCDPARCLVFEDSLPGLEAARAAGGWAVAITRGKSTAQLDAARKLAHLCVEDFTALPAGFFARAGEVADS